MNNFKKILTFSLCWLMLTTALSAQVTTLESEYFSVNDGLSERQINDILLSRYGLIWLATDRGLNMFDGYSFQTFISNENDSTALSISANQVERLVESEDGTFSFFTKTIFPFLTSSIRVVLKIKRLSCTPNEALKEYQRPLLSMQTVEFSYSPAMKFLIISTPTKPRRIPLNSLHG